MLMVHLVATQGLSLTKHHLQSDLCSIMNYNYNYNTKDLGTLERSGEEEKENPCFHTHTATPLQIYWINKKGLKH